MKYIANAFSIQMIGSLVKEGGVNISFTEISDLNEIKEADVMSAVGHPDTAAVISNLLGKEVPANRINISLEKGDILYVAQIIGGRLPEGGKTLPENVERRFFKVEV